MLQFHVVVPYFPLSVTFKFCFDTGVEVDDVGLIADRGDEDD